MKYKFKYTFFESNLEPTCNLCHSNLIFKNRVSKIEGNYCDIIKCSDDNCITNTKKLKRKELWKVFLPNEVYENLHKKMYNIMLSNNYLKKEFWIKKGFSIEESLQKIFEIQSMNSKKVKNRFVVSKENLKNNGYTNDKIKNICQTPSMVSFWVNKGYTKEKSVEKIKENQSYASKFIDFEKRLLPSNVDYWLKLGFSVEESKKKVFEKQTTFSKDICIKKYGYEKGIEIFTNRTNKWQDSLNKNGNLKIGYSKISQEIFKEISITMKREDFLFATNGGEFRLNRKNGGVWIYDFTDVKNKKIIEFNGDMYHANPDKYSELETPHPFRKNITSGEIWKKDNEKINIAKINGFDILVIWDSEYRKKSKLDKEKIIQKCINFINS